MSDPILRVIAEAMCPPDAPYCIERMTDEDAVIVRDALLAAGYRLFDPGDVAALRDMLFRDEKDATWVAAYDRLAARLE